MLTVSNLVANMLRETIANKLNKIPFHHSTNKRYVGFFRIIAINRALSWNNGKAIGTFQSSLNAQNRVFSASAKTLKKREMQKFAKAVNNKNCRDVKSLELHQLAFLN